MIANSKADRYLPIFLTYPSIVEEVQIDDLPSVPLAPFSPEDDDFIYLEDGAVPLGAMPQTGVDNNMSALIAGFFASMLAAAFAGLSIFKLKKKD